VLQSFNKNLALDAKANFLYTISYWIHIVFLPFLKYAEAGFINKVSTLPHAVSK